MAQMGEGREYIAHDPIGAVCLGLFWCRKGHIHRPVERDDRVEYPLFWLELL